MRFPKNIMHVCVSVLLIVFFCLPIYATEGKTIINLANSFEGLQLGTTVDIFVRDPAWKEVFGSEKEMFDAGLPLAQRERLFKKSSGDKVFYCGFVFGKLFKIGLSAPASNADLYLKKFSDNYGKAKQIETNWYVWENDKIGLELIKGPDLNIFLTDKNLLRKAIR